MNSKQRAYLKSLASTMNPIFQVGKASLTPEIVTAIDEALVPPAPHQPVAFRSLMLFSILQRDDDALGHQFRRQSQVFQQLITPPMLHEGIRDAEGQHRRGQPFAGQERADHAAKAARQHMLLHRDDWAIRQLTQHFSSFDIPFFSSS